MRNDRVSSMKSCSLALLILVSTLFWFIWACQYAWLTVASPKYSSFYARWYYVFICITLIHVFGLIFYVFFRKKRRKCLTCNDIKWCLHAEWVRKDLGIHWTGNMLDHKAEESRQVFLFRPFSIDDHICFNRGTDSCYEFIHTLVSSQYIFIKN